MKLKIGNYTKQSSPEDKYKGLSFEELKLKSDKLSEEYQWYIDNDIFNERVPIIRQELLYLTKAILRAK